MKEVIVLKGGQEWERIWKGDTRDRKRKTRESGGNGLTLKAEMELIWEDRKMAAPGHVVGWAELGGNYGGTRRRERDGWGLAWIVGRESGRAREKKNGRASAGIRARSKKRAKRGQ